jgi:hypothetical protein
MTNTIINLTNPPFFVTARIDFGSQISELAGIQFNDAFGYAN